MIPAEVWGNLKTAMRDIPMPTKALMLLLVVLYLFTFTPMTRHLIVVPGSVIPPDTQVWTLVTGGFTEQKLIYLLVDLIVVLASSKLYEPLWGSMEFLKFVAIVNVASCLGTVMTCLFFYSISKSLTILFVSFSGMTGAIFGFTVVWKQAFPQRALKALAFSIESRLIPLLSLSVMSLLYVLGAVPATNVIMAFFGILSAWIYLRFYQGREGVRGDGSEPFAFHDFFPQPLQPIVSMVSDKVFKVVVMLRLCPKEPRQYDMNGPSSIKISLPGVNAADAQRRRQIALRDLDSRLKVAPGPNTPNKQPPKEASQEENQPKPETSGEKAEPATIAAPAPAETAVPIPAADSST